MPDRHASSRGFRNLTGSRSSQSGSKGFLIIMRFIVIGGGCYGIYHSGQLYKAIQKGKLPADSRLIIVDRNAAPAALAEHGAKPNFEFVQSDWQTFLQQFLADPAAFEPNRDGDQVQIVPAPFAPHLFFDWLRFATEAALVERDRSDIAVERTGFDHKMHLPYEFTDQSGNHFISRAGWTCPSSCIEPQKCPAVKGPRDWDLDLDLRNFVAGQSVKPSVSAASALSRASLPNGHQATALLDAPEPGLYSGVETFTCHHFVHGIGTVPARRLFEARQRLLILAESLTPARPRALVAVGTVSHCHGVVATIALSLKS